MLPQLWVGKSTCCVKKPLLTESMKALLDGPPEYVFQSMSLKLKSPMIILGFCTALNILANASLFSDVELPS